MGFFLLEAKLFISHSEETDWNRVGFSWKIFGQHGSALSVGVISYTAQNFILLLCRFPLMHYLLFFQALQKEVINRLGCGDSSGEEIKKHIFFRNINWPQLEAGIFKPPFVPDVSLESH